MVLDIVKYNQDSRGILRKENIDVKNNEHSKFLISDMIETLNVLGGVGLAAPQVSKNLNLFIISFGELKEVFINPKIYAYGYSEQMSEMCLSVPNIPIAVTRKSKVRIQYHNTQWQYKQQEFDGPLARIIQHEYDHLLGKLIIDY
jgi:peptide deformylase